jgi:putative transposase
MPKYQNALIRGGKDTPVGEYTLSDVRRIVKDEFEDSLEEYLRTGARKMLQAALQLEVSEYIDRFKSLTDPEGHRQVVRNGYSPARDLVTGIGKIEVKQPRVQDRRFGETFTSAILPKYARRSPSIDTLIPALYLKGVSTSSFPEALKAILGENVGGLSAANITRLKAIWDDERKAWEKRDLSNKHYVYIWADGIYFNVRLEPDRPCILVLIGATAGGCKELVAVVDGHRESKLSWQTLLQDLKARGLADAPAVAVGDGSLGFWAALEEAFPTTRHQRCWVHKTANVLDRLPKRIQKDAKGLIHQMYLSPTKADALQVFNRFLALYNDKYPKACECLIKDQKALFTFYDFPAPHWVHLRSTNPIESTFATVRHRTRQTKGCGSRSATIAMVYKLAIEAEKNWLRLRGYRLIKQVVAGVAFVDGEIKKAA